jgi:hypothetical protein
MMQSIAGIEIRRGFGSHNYHVGVPLLLLSLAALPFVILVAPIALVACLALGVNPLQGVREFGRLLTSLRGTHLEIEKGPNTVVVHIP